MDVLILYIYLIICLLGNNKGGNGIERLKERCSWSGSTLFLFSFNSCSYSPL